MAKLISFKKSDKPEKKYMVEIERDGRIKTVHFGASGYKDYTSFGSLEREQRKRNYISRHKSKEDWTISGIDTPGFYAKHLLWGPTPSVSRNLEIMKRKYFSS